MNILIVGSGGREHALAWKIAQSPLVTSIASAPGNPGMASLGETFAVSPTDVAGQVALAQRLKADLVVVGPDAAVAAGLADALIEVGVAVFAPTAAAGRVESSKAFTKALAAREGIPTAPYAVFTDAAEAKAGLEAFAPPYVVKADGLTAGKGVTIAATRAEAEAAIDSAMGGRFGAAGARVVLEGFLQGEEVSLFALSDGASAMAFGSAQDHKRAYDGDLGPNTGGMGCYAPSPAFDATLEAEAMARIARPALAGLAADGTPYRGVLYVGLMLTPTGPQLVEFNARFGDPETQVMMIRLESDIVPYLLACARGGLDRLPPPVWRREAGICVVLATEGYPDAPRTGGEILLPSRFEPGVSVFHAGTALKDGRLICAGGRTLNICALGETLAEARDKAHRAIASIVFPGGFHRRDIGWRALAPTAPGR